MRLTSRALVEGGPDINRIGAQIAGCPCIMRTDAAGQDCSAKRAMGFDERPVERLAAPAVGIVEDKTVAATRRERFATDAQRGPDLTRLRQLTGQRTYVF